MSGSELISNYQHSITKKRLNQLRLKPLATNVYLSQLPNPTPSHHLSSIHLAKCIRNEGCFINKFSPLIIYLPHKPSSRLFSDWIDLRSLSEISIADNKIRPGQITRPMPIGRARARKTSEMQPIFRASPFCLVKNQIPLDLQFFNRIGRTMKELL